MATTIGTTATRDPAYERALPLAHVVCGVDGSAGAEAAVRQAASLAGKDCRLDLVAVIDEASFGPVADTFFTRAGASRALARAGRVAASHGIEAHTRTVVGSPPARALLEAADGADLLVVGGHGHSRASGVLVGSTASRIVHTARLPVLIVRPDRSRQGLLRNVLVACGGSFGSAAVDFTARLVVGAEARVTLLRVSARTDPATVTELATASADLESTLGVEPVELLAHGAATHALVAAAGTHDASLLVLGSRGLRGPAAVRSVSERVAHKAPCSVLVVRPGEEPEA
jgi:nucleotide-binding universal stress UspA family protein